MTRKSTIAWLHYRWVGEYSILTEVFFIFLFLMSCVSPLQAELSTISLEELEPGMSGYGLTVLKGAEPEKFKVTLVDIIQGPLPGRRSLLIRVETRNLKIGSGFSGSPIYFRGRLAGAVAYVEQYRSEEIVGVTPIAYMLEEARKAKPAKEDLTSRPSLEGRKKELSSLQPGSMITVALMRGDIWFGSSGTVTAIEGDLVLAFGHENGFMGDSITLPMHNASVNALISRLDLSHKIATGSTEIGAVVWDGKTAIIGRFDKRAEMIPFTVSLKGETGLLPRSYKMEMVGYSQIIPGLVSAALSSIIQAHIHENPQGAGISVDYKVLLKDDPEPLVFSQRYDVGKIKENKEQAGAVLQQFLSNLSDISVVRAVALEITELPDGRTGKIDEAWFSKARAQAGEKVILQVRLSSSLEETALLPVEVVIPAELDLNEFTVSIVSGKSVRPLESGPYSRDELKAWTQGLLRSDELVVLFPADGNKNAYYPKAGLGRVVTRAPWAVEGSAEARISVVGN